MSFSAPKLLYQGSALLFALSVIGHVKTGRGIVSSSLQPLGTSKGAEMVKMDWMMGGGYLLACAAIIHKFSYTPAEHLTANDTIFMVTVWITNVYGGWSFARLGHTPGAVILFLRSSLLIVAHLVQYFS